MKDFITAIKLWPLLLRQSKAADVELLNTAFFLKLNSSSPSIQ
jgi:hypothetical protein